jgi:hypothetical protein
MARISLFLDGCTTRFRIPSSDLFTAPDLYEKRNVKIVVTTILALKRSFQREESKRDKNSSSLDSQKLLYFYLISFTWNADKSNAETTPREYIPVKKRSGST